MSEDLQNQQEKITNQVQQDKQLKQKNNMLIEDSINQQNQSLDNNNKSLWIAKKLRSDTEKNIDILANRILLLKKEEERTLKRIADTQTKAQNVLEAKKRNEDTSMKKNSNKKQDDDFLQMMQQRSYKLRRQQEEEREAIRHALYELKREETLEIKRQSQLNKQKIDDARRKSLDERKIKTQQVQFSVEKSKQNIEQYWQERIKFFENQQDKTRVQNLKAKQQKDNILQKLEQEEQDLIRRLQQSQEIHENACRELEKVIQLPANEYIKEKNQLSYSQSDQNFAQKIQKSEQSQQPLILEQVDKGV